MKLGIALAGGGARGAAHIGILQALEENGIKGDMYSGTSAGSIVASAKALGYTNRQLIDLLGQINSSLLDVDYYGILKGLVVGLDTLDSLAKGKKLKKFLDTNFSQPINTTRYPLGIVSTDINTGTQVIFASRDITVDPSIDDLLAVYGNIDVGLNDIIYSSTAIPGIFPPYYYNEHKLVDGSLVNNLPVNILRAMGADKVVAVDLNSINVLPVQGVMQTITRTLGILIDQNEDYSLGYMSDHYLIRPEMTGISQLDFDKAQDAYTIGYKFGRSIMNQVYDFVYEDA